MNTNRSEKTQRRFFALTSLGRDRWYWVVWPSLDELQASETPLLHIGEGYEKTKAEAVDKAWNLAGRYGEWIEARYAAAYHHSRAGTVRGGQNPRFSGSPAAPVPHEFLYRDKFDAASGDRVSMPHRVVRKTRKYVYVEQTPYSAGDLTGSWLDRDRPTFRLDREALEREEYAFISASIDIGDDEEPVFFSAEGIGRQRDRMFRCLEVLGLSWPCTAGDVREAYRKRVKSAHPDGGGDHDRFLEVQNAYEQALRICREP